MSRRLIRSDQNRGIDVYVDIDADGAFTFVEVARTSGLQQQINEKLAEHRPGSMIGNTQRHMQEVAQLPLPVVHQLMREGRWRDDKAMRKWLNDPDNRCFRTTGGKV